MSAISAAEARRRLLRLIEQVNEDHLPVEVVSRHGSAVLVSKEGWDSMQETAYLLRSPANAEWLIKGLAEVRPGEAAGQELDRS